MLFFLPQKKRVANPGLLWDSFEQAVSGSVNSETFKGALGIKGIAISKLTQTLFLIDPTSFLPLDGKSSLALGIGKYTEPPREIEWEEYCRELTKIRMRFQGANATK